MRGSNARRGASALLALFFIADNQDASASAASLAADKSGPYGPLTPLHADCRAIATTFDPAAADAFCDPLFGANTEPPVTYEDCIEQGSSLDAERAVGLCSLLYPLLGYSSPSPVTGPTHYVEMPDGTLIATVIKMPKVFVPGRQYPVVIEMSGYESGSDDGRTVSGDLADATGLETPLQTGTRGAHGKYYEDEYVSITASVRGTGCSSGEFDVFSETSAIDGYHLIEWAATQPWANGDVGLFGHSYSGITAALIAATQPPHLRVASISGLIGDIYRDIVYPGGVSNYGFPLIWTAGYRPFTDVAGATLAGLLADTGDRRCLHNQAARSRTVTGEPIVNGLQDWDGPWYQARSVVYKADAIQVPTHVVSAYQDEQTGPRGATNVFDHLRDTLHKRLVLLNGDHDAQAQLPETIAERKAWLDYWLLHRENPFVDPARQPTSVRVLLEVHEFEDGERSNGEITSSDFPLPETDWTDWYLQPSGGLATTPPPANGGGTVYLHGTKRQAYAYQAGVDTFGELTSASGPDEAFFRSEPFAEPMVIAGPLTSTLFVRALPADLPLPLPTDLELMVQVLDEGPGGELTYLQRGVLRASHRAIDPARSQFTNEDRIYRPYRPHTGPLPDLLLANQIYELLIDIFPVGHVFRPGHRLAIKVHAPSLDDNDWIYIPKAPPALVTLFHDAEHPSSVMLPVIPLADVDRLGEDLGRCASSRVRCVQPSG